MERFKMVYFLGVGVLLGFSVVLLSGCSTNLVRISGTVVRISGNQMPSPDLPPSKPRGFETMVYFFQPAGPGDVGAAKGDGTVGKVNTRLVDSVRSATDGQFALALRPGVYSVFIGKPEGGYYANITDGNGVFNPITLEKGKKKKLSLRADWGVYY